MSCNRSLLSSHGLRAKLLAGHHWNFSHACNYRAKPMLHLSFVLSMVVPAGGARLLCYDFLSRKTLEDFS